MEYAEVFELFRNPLHPYTVGLMGALPSVDKKGRLQSIPGTVPSLDALPSGCRLCARCAHATDRCRKEEPQLRDVGGGHLVRCFLREEGGKEEA